MGPRAGLDAAENLALHRGSNSEPSSESLCRLSNPGRIVVHNYVRVIDTRDLAQQLIGAFVRLGVASAPQFLVYHL